MIERIKLSPFLRDIVITSATSVATVLSIIITTKLLAQGLGPEEFGVYSLARRVVATILPFSTLMMDVAVARYLSILKDDHLEYSYLLSGFFLGVIPGFSILIIGLVSRSYLTGLIYHNQVYIPLFNATLLMIIGCSFYVVLLAFYRGRNRMGRFNCWQIGVKALGPLLIAWTCANYGKAYLIVLLMSFFFSLSIVPLGFHAVRGFFHNRKIRSVKVVCQLKELFLYGFPRTPGGFMFAGLFAIGPFLAPYFGSIKEAGYLVVGQSVFRVFESGIIAFGLLALPKVARLSVEGRDEFLKERIEDTIAFVFHLGLFAALHLILWSDRIVILWLGVQYAEAVSFMIVLLVALVPYLAYIMLRSIIDALQEKAVNSLNLLIAFITSLVFSVILVRSRVGTIGLAIGATLGFAVLGTLSVLYLWRSYKLRGNLLMIRKCLLLNILFIAVAFCLRQCWFEKAFNGLTLVVIAFMMESLFLAIYCFILRKWSVRWIVELERRILRNPANS